MKKVLLYIGISILLLNILAGFIISIYHPLNILVNSIIIVTNTIMMVLLSSTKQKTAYTISLSFLFGIAEIIQLVLGCIMPEHYINNWQLLVIISLLIIEIILFIIANIFSKNIK